MQMKPGEIKQIEVNSVTHEIHYHRMDNNWLGIAIYTNGVSIPLTARVRRHGQAMDFIEKELSKLSCGWLGDDAG